MKVTKELKELAQIFEPLTTLYVVGGSVRNSLMGMPYYDIDICSAISPQKVKKILEESEYKCTPINEKLGTLLITRNSERYEYTTFRHDSYNKKGTHLPSKSSFTQNIILDCLRRDFTINAIYYDILKDNYLDYVKGIKDIKKRKICTVDSPQVTFYDDGLRLLRMIRFACELNFKIEKNTLKQARRNACNLKEISAERIRQELIKILHSDKTYNQKSNRYIYGTKIINKCKFLPNIFDFKINNKIKFKNLENYGDKIDRMTLFCIDIYNACGYDIESFVKIIAKNICLTTAEKIYIKKILFALIDLPSFDNDFMIKNFDILPELILLGHKKVCKKLKILYTQKITSKAPTDVSKLKISAADLIKLGAPKIEISRLLKEVLLYAFENPNYNKKSYLTKFVKSKLKLENTKE
ncbi:MAG: hypothetical protein PHP83_01820 [Clostridia bacterium]|nr:hypothetical protein [Clostridia bacterium]